MKLVSSYDLVVLYYFV